jgi:excisionase family DNA binding protein
MPKKTNADARTRSKREKSRRRVVKNRSGKRYNPRMGQVGAESVPIAEAARLLGMSVRTAKREMETGRLRSFRTSGGHWRVLKSDVEAFRQGITTPASAPAPSVLQNKREGVEELRAELDKRKLERELSKLDAEDAKTNRERDEVFRTQRLTVKAKLADVRLQRETNAQQQDRERRQRERDQWRRAWINGARKEFPAWLSVEHEQALLASIETELGLWDMEDAQESIGHALDRTIERVIAPWRAEREARARREQTVQSAVSLLPWGATDSDKARAVASVRAALSTVPLEARDSEVRVALDGVLAPVIESILKSQTRARRERLMESAAHSLRAWNSTEADKVHATAAVRSALADLPLGAAQTEEHNAVAAALAPIKRSIEERAAAQRERESRERKKPNLISFAVFHACNYLDEQFENGDIDLDAGEDFDDVRRNVAAAVQSTLEEELTGDESQDEANRIACKIVDEELD